MKNEINKVQRRLRLWSKRPDQINSKILKAYLELKRGGRGEIREKDLEELFSDKKSFQTNFIQMRIIADRNHGKVFDQEGEFVNIWGPVEEYISKFESDAFE